MTFRIAHHPSTECVHPSNGFHPLAKVDGLGGIVGPAFAGPLEGRVGVVREEEERAAESDSF